MGWAFEADIHKEIVREALPFIKEAYLKVIADASDDPDGEPPRPLELKLGWPPWSSPWHFDNCDFIEGVSSIKGHYDMIRPLVDPKVVLAKAEEIAQLFGELLHPAQDLYAHSNWVETMAAVGRGITLFDSGIGRKWWVDGHWKGHPPGVIIAQGEKETLPKGWVEGRSGQGQTSGHDHSGRWLLVVWDYQRHVWTPGLLSR